MARAKYNRILLKLSGEALAHDSDFVIDPNILDRLAIEIGDLKTMDTQVAIVIGGGNLFRGKTLSELGISRITGDYMGMLATIINSLALRDALERSGLNARVMSAIPMSGVVDSYDRRKAMQYLDDGSVVIFAGGTGNPLVTTDTAASLRSIEINADVLIKATNVDGVYDLDPRKYDNAVCYESISYQEVLAKELGVMDLSAFCQCRDHNMKVVVYNVNKIGALKRIVLGDKEGTLVS